MDLPQAIKSWRLNAAKQQQTFYSLLSDRQWDELDRSHKYFKNNLQTKISLALFAETFSKCSPDQQTRISATLETCLQLTGCTDTIRLGYTYVHIFDENERESILPLIRIKSRYGKIYFLEIIQPGKVYENWDNFLRCNNISASYICYPKNGIYEKQSDKLISLEYNKTLKKDDATKNNLPVSVFFPFYKNLHKVGIYSSEELTHIIIDQITNDKDPLFEVNDQSIFVEWLRNTKIYDEGIDSESVSSMVLESSAYFTAVRYFKCIYTTSSRVNSHKFIITLMTILFKQKMGKCKQEDYNDFLAGLIFFLNITAEISFVKEVVAKLNERPLHLQNCFMASNLKYEEVKELQLVSFDQKPAVKTKCDRSANGMCYVLKQISDMEEMESNFISHPVTSKKIVDFINGLGDGIRNDSSFLFWMLVTENLNLIFTEYMSKVLNDDFPTIRLKELWDQIAFPRKTFSATITEYAPPSLARKILLILNRINNNFTMNTRTYSMKDHVKAQLLEYALELAYTFNCEGDEYFADICAMVVEKFISWFDCMAVESKSKKSKLNISDVELIIGRIFAEFNKESVTKQLKIDYEKLYEMKQVSFLGEPEFVTNDMELYYFRMSRPFGEYDLTVTNIIIAMNYLIGKDDTLYEHMLENIAGILRLVYKSNVVLVFQRKDGKKVHGFFLKIRFPEKC